LLAPTVQVEPARTPVTGSSTHHPLVYCDVWAALKGYLDEVTATAAPPVIEKYTGVIAAADVFTESTTFSG
jgi:hypothetical protein